VDPEVEAFLGGRLHSRGRARGRDEADARTRPGPKAGPLEAVGVGRPEEDLGGAGLLVDGPPHLGQLGRGERIAHEPACQATQDRGLRGARGEAPQVGQLVESQRRRAEPTRPADTLGAEIAGEALRGVPVAVERPALGVLEKLGAPEGPPGSRELPWRGGPRMRCAQQAVLAHAVCAGDAGACGAGELRAGACGVCHGGPPHKGTGAAAWCREGRSTLGPRATMA